MKKLITYKMALIIATILFGGMVACEKPQELNSGRPIFARGSNKVTIDSKAKKISVTYAEQDPKLQEATIHYITNFANGVKINQFGLEEPLKTSYKGEWYTFQIFNNHVEFEAEPNTSKESRGVNIGLMLPIPYLDHFAVTQAPDLDPAPAAPTAHH